MKLNTRVLRVVHTPTISAGRNASLSIIQAANINNKSTIPTHMHQDSRIFNPVSGTVTPQLLLLHLLELLHHILHTDAEMCEFFHKL